MIFALHDSSSNLHISFSNLQLFAKLMRLETKIKCCSKCEDFVMPTPMTSPRPRRSRLDPIPPNEPLDHETRHTWNPRSARDTCVPHEDSPFWTPRPKNVPKDDAHRHTPRTCIEARNVYLNSLYFLSLISPIFHVQHSFPCI